MRGGQPIGVEALAIGGGRAALVPARGGDGAVGTIGGVVGQNGQ